MLVRLLLLLSGELLQFKKGKFTLLLLSKGIGLGIFTPFSRPSVVCFYFRYPRNALMKLVSVFLPCEPFPCNLSMTVEGTSNWRLVLLFTSMLLLDLRLSILCLVSELGLEIGERETYRVVLVERTSSSLFVLLLGLVIRFFL